MAYFAYPTLPTSYWDPVSVFLRGGVRAESAAMAHPKGFAKRGAKKPLVFRSTSPVKGKDRGPEEGPGGGCRNETGPVRVADEAWASGRGRGVRGRSDPVAGAAQRRENTPVVRVRVRVSPSWSQRTSQP